MELFPMGDSGILIRFGKEMSLEANRQVRMLSLHLEREPFPCMIEFVPALTTMYVSYDSTRLRYDSVRDTLQEIMDQMNDVHLPPGRIVNIPVCYGGEFGPDIEVVASYNGLTTEDVIAIHTSGVYMVYMIGFAPGFPYIGGMSETIATPRRASPRLSIPAGSVGIAGKQTGVYPIETPGGWQIIGRTPVPLFRQNENPPSLLAPGDTIHFRSISKEEFNNRPWRTV